MTRRGVLALVAAGLVTIMAMLLLRQYQQFSRQPLTNEQPIELAITKGDTAQKLLLQLADKGLIVNPHWGKVWLKLNPHLVNIKVGYYEIISQQPLHKVLEMMVEGREKSFSIALIEGLTWRQWWQRIQQHQAINAEQVNIEQLIRQLNLEGDSLEGWLMPDTYHVTKGTTAEELIIQAYQRMQQYLDEAWEQRQPLLPYKTPYEALIMASIIEKETAVPSERPLIAGVFVNRLERNMRLQTDPTVIYGIGEDFDGDIKRADLRRRTPYNTYVIKGLPPTPIAMPGKLAIDAALHPAQTSAIYFVARGDGSHQFSETLKQHNEAVRQYQLNK